jgi:hypothetical protein
VSFCGYFLPQCAFPSASACYCSQLVEHHDSHYTHAALTRSQRRQQKATRHKTLPVANPDESFYSNMSYLTANPATRAFSSCNCLRRLRPRRPRRYLTAPRRQRRRTSRAAVPRVGQASRQSLQIVAASPCPRLSPPALILASGRKKGGGDAHEH